MRIARPSPGSIARVRIAGLAIAALAALSSPACAAKETLTGSIRIDGSSTVFPITEAVAEEFQAANPKVRVTVGISGTGGGFKKFSANEIDVANASRPIKTSEIEACAKAGIESIEIPVAFDGLSVVVNPKNTFVTSLTVEELKKIWQPESTVKLWSDVRPGWPTKPIRLYGPGHDSGTFDYFTEAIVGKSGACRSDYTASEDDNVLVQGVEGDPNALGFFGYAYYAENTKRLKLVPIDPGTGPVAPTPETISNGTYAPLSRPVFIYVNAKSAARPEVKAFADFYIENAPALVAEVGYIPLPAEVYELTQARLDGNVVGSVYGGEGHKVGVTLQELFTVRR